jgi:hypothetical protein
MIAKMLEKLIDKYIQEKYVKAGRVFGNALSYKYFAVAVDFDYMLTKLVRWEKRYAKRGYHTITIKDFVDYGGRGKALKNLGVKRSDNENPIFYAGIYLKMYLKKILV